MTTRLLTCTYAKGFDSHGTLTAQQGVLKTPTRARKGKLARLRAIGISLCLTASLLNSMDSTEAFQYPKKTILTITDYHKYAYMRLLDTKQYDCILELYTHESNWNPTAVNGSHYGIPQGDSKWLIGKHPYIQIDWGIKYISNRYGSACSALNHWSKYGWH